MKQRRQGPPVCPDAVNSLARGRLGRERWRTAATESCGGLAGWARGFGIIGWVLVFLWSGNASRAQIGGVDTLASPEAIAGWEPAWLESWAQSGAWLRLHGLADPGSVNPREAARAVAEQAALRTLAPWKIKWLARVRWDVASWSGGVRTGAGKRVPLDLREAYERARRYGRFYGGLVAAFEFENEPDVGFVQENAETYMAFLKACSLGLKAGREEARGPAGVFERWRARVSRWVGAGERPPPPWVAMAPLSLPPGPYLDRLLANGLLSYTDVFNYHYYGYAGDFSGVYRQFEQALTAPGADAGHGRAGERTDRRSLPVLLSEYGYGSLGGSGRATREGRLRQWRWYREVAPQIHELRIAGPIAFQLNPHLENAQHEFGLTVAAGAATPEEAGAGWRAGGVFYRAEDFGEGGRQPWMETIGRSYPKGEATPALSWLLDYGASHRYRPRAWTVRAAPASPVVLDFVAGGGLARRKNFGGYFVDLPAGAAAARGVGDVVLYNFSPREIVGRVVMTRGEKLVADGGAWATTLRLAPMERRVVRVMMTVPADTFAPHEWEIRFAAESGKEAVVFSTRFFPRPERLSETIVSRLDHPAALASRQSEMLLARSRAKEEPGVQRAGRWLVTPNVRVEEASAGRWRVSVAARSPGGNPAAIAELPLPDDFAFPDHALLRLRHRLVAPADATIFTGKSLKVHFRTVSGNLYAVWPWSRAVASWMDYQEAKENFTLMYYGRAQLPWRFGENRVAALVLAFDASDEPLVFEIDEPRIVRLSASRNDEAMAAERLPP